MECDGVPKEICQARQAGFDEGFVAGQREGASVAIQTDTIEVWRAQPPPTELVFGWTLCWVIIGMLVGRFLDWATGPI